MDPDEIVRNLEGAILREPHGQEVAKIHSAGIEQAGQELRFEVEDFGTRREYAWTVETQQVIDTAGVSPGLDDIQRAITDLFTSDEGRRSVIESGVSQDPGEAAVDAVSPGPGDPELDL